MCLVDGKVGRGAFVAPDRIVALSCVADAREFRFPQLSKVLTTSATELPLDSTKCLVYQGR